MPAAGFPARFALTRLGREALALRDGWCPIAYARARGLRIGEPGRWGLEGLLAHLDHTIEADGFFLDLLHHAEQRRRAGFGDALVAWESAAACHRRVRYAGRWRNLRPDGFGIYRTGGVDHAFHLEWDRGTMKPREHEPKLAAYRAYFESAVYVADRGRTPALLYVFPDPGQEARIRLVIRAIFDDLEQSPILTTNVGLLEASGMAGPVWWRAFGEGRQAWPPA